LLSHLISEGQSFLPLCPQETFPALPISPPAASADAINSGLVDVSSGCGSYGLSLALASRLPRSPSSRRRYPSPCTRIPSLSIKLERALRRYYHSMRRSVLVHSFIVRAHSAFPMSFSHPWMRRDRWRFPSLLMRSCVSCRS